MIRWGDLGGEGGGFSWGGGEFSGGGGLGGGMSGGGGGRKGQTLGRLKGSKKANARGENLTEYFCILSLDLDMG